MTVARKTWGPNIPFEDCIKISIDAVEKARSKNILSAFEPTLYQAYILDNNTDSIIGMNEISSFFKYSSKEPLDYNIARDKILRLLSIGLKAYFFIGKKECLKHEPYIFTYPDIGAKEMKYGLILRLTNGKSIVVAENDMKLFSSKTIFNGKFPAILQDNSYKWYSTKYWSKLQEEADILAQILQPWKIKQQKEMIDSHKDKENFPYGTIIDIPYSLNALMKETGIVWARGINSWYLPKGWDLESINVYLNTLKKNQNA